MIFDNFIKDYTKHGLIKKQEKNLRAVENLISRSYKEIKIAEANIKIDGIIRIRRETKGRKGKTVTTVSGYALDDNNLKNLAKQLKRRCGTGGAQ